MSIVAARVQALLADLEPDGGPLPSIDSIEDGLVALDLFEPIDRPDDLALRMAAERLMQLRSAARLQQSWRTRR